jgi:hypothetical protein
MTLKIRSHLGSQKIPVEKYGLGLSRFSRSLEPRALSGLSYYPGSPSATVLRNEDRHPTAELTAFGDHR